MDTAEEKVISEESVAGGIFREILYLLLKIVAIATAIVVIFTFIFGVFRYADNAMLPAVKDGDLVFYYRLRNSYVASDLVVLNYQGKEQVRRVIATAGDVVDITEDGLTIKNIRFMKRHSGMIREWTSQSNYRKGRFSSWETAVRMRQTVECTEQ